MKTWPKVKLGDICAINPKVQSPDVDSLISVVPMSAVSETGEIDASAVQPFGDVSKGLTLFQEGDVLFAKITPCMENGKGAVAVGLRGGIGAGSTEFFVLRPDSKRVTSAWIYHFTKREAFRRLAAERMTGSGGQRRVPRVFLESVTLPIPPLAEQERIAAELDAVAATLKKRQTQLAELNALVEARFAELFGDTKNNSYGFSVTALAKVAQITAGQGAPQKEIEYGRVGKPFVKAAHINALMHGALESECLCVTEEIAKKYRLKVFKADSIVFAKSGMSCLKGYVHCLTQDVYLVNHLACVTITSLQKISPLFLKYYFLKYSLGNLAKDESYPSIRLSDIGKLEIPLPPLELQERFAMEVKQIEAIKANVRAGIAETQTLFDALTQKYFG